MIPPELAAFAESGVSILVGTRDARLAPDCVRGLGVRVEPGREQVTVFLPAATSGQTLRNLAENGRIAVCLCKVDDHRTIQLKGRAVATASAEEADRALVEGYRTALAAALLHLGLPTRITCRLNLWPCFAVRVHVEEIYDQTPGPGAGSRLGETPHRPQAATP